MGRKHEPSFRLVLTDSKNSTKSGRFAEILGAYDPRKSSEALKADRIKHWIAQGAGLTATVNNILIKKGLIRGKKIDVSAGAAPAPVAEAPVLEEAPVETPVATPVIEEATPVVAEIPAPAESTNDIIEPVPTE